MKTERHRSSRAKSLILWALLFLIGLAVMSYPFVSNIWNQMRTESIVKEYRYEVGNTPSEELEEEYRKACSYNESHKSNVILDVFGFDEPAGKEYMAILNPGNDGIMGYIEIPKIRQRIVIYHGTTEETLQKGCGHIAGTSLPVGGESSHSVIAAHRGLPKAKLFSDIDQLEEGDEFYLFILNKTLAYEVDCIRIVEPDSLENLQIIEGEDFVTLFTCTPYSVNTHRLLVRGHRIPYKPKKNDTQTDAEIIVRYWLWILMLVLLTTIMGFIIRRKRHIKGERRTTKQE